MIGGWHSGDRRINALDILHELTRREDLTPYARKAYGMLREILVECNGN